MSFPWMPRYLRPRADDGRGAAATAAGGSAEAFFMKRYVILTALISSAFSAGVAVLVVMVMLPSVAGAQASRQPAAGLSAAATTSQAGLTAQATPTTVQQLQVVGADGQTVGVKVTSSGLQLLDPNGKVRYNMALDSQENASIAMYDANGNEIWSAP